MHVRLNHFHWNNVNARCSIDYVLYILEENEIKNNKKQKKKKKKQWKEQPECAKGRKQLCYILFITYVHGKTSVLLFIVYGFKECEYKLYMKALLTAKYIEQC